MKVYVVYLTYYKGCKLPPWYIGSTYKSKIDQKNQFVFPPKSIDFRRDL